MKEITIRSIPENNIMRKLYLKTISSWNNGVEFSEVAKNQPFMGVFYGDKFLGASIMQVSPTLEVSFTIINGSLQHKEEIDEYFLQELSAMALANGATSVTFNTEKEEVKQKQIVLK